MIRFWLSLLSVVAISAVSQAADTEAEAVDFVKRNHGSVSRAKPDGPVTGVWLTDVTNDGFQVIAGFSHLTNLSLSPHWTSGKKSRISNDGLQHLSSLKKLTHLDLHSSTVTDIGLTHLAKFKELQVLNLNNTEVTDVGLRSLTDLKELVHLDLSMTAVTDKGLSSLTGLPNLKSLELDLTRVSDKGLKDVARINSLEQLTLGGVRITATGIQELTQLKNLSRLVVSPLTDAHLVELAKSKLLHTLIQSQTIAQVMGEAKPPAKGEEVLYFDLSNESEVTVEGLKALASLKHLTKINIPKTIEVDDSLLLALSKVGLLKALLRHETEGVFPPELSERITHLDFSNAKITAKGIATLKPFRDIVRLKLPQLDDAALEEVAKIDLLHALPNATIDGATRAEKAEDVLHLDLTETGVTVNGLKAIAPLKNLVSLALPSDIDLDDKLLTELGKIRLLHALPQALGKDGGRPEKPASVTVFNLRDSKVTTAGWKALKAFKNLEILELDEISDEALTNLQQLEMLHVLPHASADGGKRAAKAADVTEVDLRLTTVSDKGLKELASFKNLTKLTLSGEKITDNSLSSLAEFKKLSNLDLIGTRITPEGVKKLRKALPKCEINE